MRTNKTRGLKLVARRLRNIITRPDFFQADVYSYTHEGREVSHTATVDMKCGCTCTCPDYQYRGSKTGVACKHLETAFAYLNRNARKVAA